MRSEAEIRQVIENMTKARRGAERAGESDIYRVTMLPLLEVLRWVLGDDTVPFAAVAERMAAIEREKAGRVQ